MVKEVFSLFEETNKGGTAIKYAHDLARRIKADLVILVLHSDYDDLISGEGYNIVGGSGVINSKENAGESRNLRDEAICRVKTAIEESGMGDPFISYRLHHGDLSNFVTSSGQIIVRNDFIGRCEDVSQIVPFGETNVCGRGEGEVMIPFGSGESGKESAKIGLSLARKLGLGVVFWHTTWKNRKVLSPEPEEHMVIEAKNVLSEIQKRADDTKVKHRYVIETADDVVEGIIRFALKEHAVMIVMSRGRNTGMGRYGERLIERRSPVPVLITAVQSGTVDSKTNFGECRYPEIKGGFRNDR